MVYVLGYIPDCILYILVKIFLFTIKINLNITEKLKIQLKNWIHQKNYLLKKYSKSEVCIVINA